MFNFSLQTADLLQVYGGQMDMIFSVHVNSERVSNSTLLHEIFATR